MMPAYTHIASFVGYDGNTAQKWAQSVRQWAPLYLAELPELEQFYRAFEHMNKMLHQALSKTPNVTAYKYACREYHRIMLTTFPKAGFHIYEHALLVHVPKMLAQGTLMNGSSFFLEAFNKVWKFHLQHRTNNGGGKRKEAQEEEEGAQHARNNKQSAASVARRKAERLQPDGPAGSEDAVGSV